MSWLLPRGAAHHIHNTKRYEFLLLEGPEFAFPADLTFWRRVPNPHLEFSCQHWSSLSYRSRGKLCNGQSVAGVRVPVSECIVTVQLVSFVQRDEKWRCKISAFFWHPESGELVRANLYGRLSHRISWFTVRTDQKRTPFPVQWDVTGEIIHVSIGTCSDKV